MKNRDYREAASEIVERYLTAEGKQVAPFSSDDYREGYRDALQMVLSVLSEREMAETKNFYRFSKVFEEQG